MKSFPDSVMVLLTEPVEEMGDGSSRRHGDSIGSSPFQPQLEAGISQDRPLHGNGNGIELSDATDTFNHVCRMAGNYRLRK